MGRALHTYIKWPGGKGRILKKMVPLLPREVFDKDFVDPFFGGGSSLLAFRPKRKAFISDIDPDLMTFYALVSEKNHDLLDYIFSLSKFWDQFDYFVSYTVDWDNGAIENLKIEVPSEPIQKYKEELTIHIGRSINQKLKKLRSILARAYEERGNKLDEAARKTHVETAARGGFYYFLRDIFNKEITAEDPLRYAAFYFVRELCFGSMFRFNDLGKFNIPYGGMSYNGKRFNEKLKTIIHGNPGELLRHSTIRVADFRETLKDVGRGYFVFLDPPYLTDFSEYGGYSFTEKDHMDLIDWLEDFDGDYLLIVAGKKTVSLYEKKLRMMKKGFIYTFDGEFRFSVRNRNERETRYLIATSKSLNREHLMIAYPLFSE
uniref:TfiI restriction endonuclease n=1 Tax=Thermus filiformis TaxID=276 RepID=Q9F8S3_THEFI|nr:TfiI methylase [Thermus filiformis]